MTIFSLISWTIAILVTAFIAYGRRHYTPATVLLIVEFLLVVNLLLRVF